jgi:hypothetical protein
LATDRRGNERHTFSQASSTPTISETSQSRFVTPAAIAGVIVGREGAEVVGYVGTNDPIAKYHELGTRTIPPRSFLGEAAMRKEHKIHEMMERTIAATFDRGGPHYRELRELFNVLHMAYEESKKLFDELVDDDEQ